MCSRPCHPSFKCSESRKYFHGAQRCCCCCSGFGKEHITAPWGLPAEPRCLARGPCTSLSTCPALRLWPMWRRGQSNTSCGQEGVSLPCQRTSQRRGDKVTPVPAFLVPSALSDSVLVGADVVLLLGFPG